MWIIWKLFSIKWIMQRMVGEGWCWCCCCAAASLIPFRINDSRLASIWKRIFICMKVYTLTKWIQQWSFVSWNLSSGATSIRFSCYRHLYTGGCGRGWGFMFLLFGFYTFSFPSPAHPLNFSSFLVEGLYRASPLCIPLSVLVRGTLNIKISFSVIKLSAWVLQRDDGKQ